MKGINWLAILLIVFFAAAFVIVGCDDDDDDDDASGGSGPEYEKCIDFLELICERLSSCTDSSYSECMSAAREEFGCEDVIEVRDSYDECMNAIDNQSCEELLDPNWELPEPCQGVFLTY